MTAPPAQGEVPSPTDTPRTAWRRVLRRSVKQIKLDGLTDRAGGLTYYGVLAIFPALLVLVSILGLIGESRTQQLLDNVHSIAPHEVYNFLHSAITQVQGRGGSAGIAAVVGVLIALWSASAYVASFTRSMNAIYGIAEGRPFWRTAPLRLAVTLLLVVMTVISALIVAVTGPLARHVGHGLGIGDVAVTIWDIAKWPVLVIIVSVIITLLYWATPNVKQPGIRVVIPGAVLAVVLWLVLSGGFGIYVSFFGSYNKTYGSLATVIVFLIWLWLSNLAILLGAEFNSELERERAIRAGMPPDNEPYVPLRSTRKLPPNLAARVAEAERVRLQTVGR